MSTEKITDKLFFSERLKSLRGTKKKAVFARELGFPAPVYQRYEEGRIPSGNNLSVIAERCGVTVDWLLGRDAAPDPVADPAAPSLAAVSPAACRIPADCDVAARLEAIEKQMDEMRKLLISLLAEERGRGVGGAGAEVKGGNEKAG